MDRFTPSLCISQNKDHQCLNVYNMPWSDAENENSNPVFDLSAGLILDLWWSQLWRVGCPLSLELWQEVVFSTHQTQVAFINLILWLRFSTHPRIFWLFDHIVMRRICGRLNTRFQAYIRKLAFHCVSGWNDLKPSIKLNTTFFYTRLYLFVATRQGGFLIGQMPDQLKRL